MAHPNANGFLGSPFPAGGIPAAYTLIANKFFDLVFKNKASTYRIYKSHNCDLSNRVAYLGQISPLLKQATFILFTFSRVCLPEILQSYICVTVLTCFIKFVTGRPSNQVVRVSKTRLDISRKGCLALFAGEESSISYNGDNSMNILAL